MQELQRSGTTAPPLKSRRPSLNMCLCLFTHVLSPSLGAKNKDKVRGQSLEPVVSRVQEM